MIVAYRFPNTDSTCDRMGINHMSKDYAMRRRNERKLLHHVKRQDCRKQLAVYNDDKILVGFVNMYHDGKAFWHDVTTSCKPGRTHSLDGQTWKLSMSTMKSFTGAMKPYAVRF